MITSSMGENLNIPDLFGFVSDLLLFIYFLMQNVKVKSKDGLTAFVQPCVTVCVTEARRRGRRGQGEVHWSELLYGATEPV
jgi:hypothetical protein